MIDLEIMSTCTNGICLKFLKVKELELLILIKGKRKNLIEINSEMF